MSITKISPSVVDFDDGITISTADNLDTLTLTSTDADANAGPNLRLYRNSGSPADSDVLGLIEFEGRNDNSQDVVYSTVDSRLVDASDSSEDGSLELTTIVAGSQVSRVFMGATETVVNDNSIDVDFRVESDNNTHAIFVQGSDGYVGIGGTSGPNAPLTVVANSGANAIRMNGRSADNYSELYASSNDGGTNYSFLQGHSAQTKLFTLTATPLIFGTNSTEEVRILSGGGITFNGDTSSANALDDYEEGTYNPTYTGASATGSQGYSVQNGYYVKVGSLITVFFDFTVSSSSGMSGAPYVALPFPSVNQAWYAPFVPWEVTTGFTDSDQKAAGYVASNSSVMVMHKYTAGNSLIESGYLNINTTGRISGQVTYQTA